MENDPLRFSLVEIIEHLVAFNLLDVSSLSGGLNDMARIIERCLMRGGACELTGYAVEETIPPREQNIT